MEQRSITLAGETFRLTYNIKTSLRIIESARPDKSVIQLVDSRRLDDRVLLIVAGLDETHEKDAKNRLTLNQVTAIAERVSNLIQSAVESFDPDKGEDLDHALLDMQRAIGESGIAGVFFTYDTPFAAVALGKAPATAVAT